MNNTDLKNSLLWAFSDRTDGNCSHPQDPNTKQFLSRFGLSNQDLVMMEQVHGDKIGRASTGEEVMAGVDGLTSQDQSLILGVKTADCLPILVGTANGRLGAIHAGWRNLLKRLPQKVMQDLQKEVAADKIQVIIGPAIHNCCYNVEAERADRFVAEFDNQTFTKTINGKTYLDLPAVAQLQLQEAGLPADNIQINQTCTACSEEHFSYRGRRTGNNLAIITWQKNQ